MQGDVGRSKPTFSQVGEYASSDGDKASVLAASFWDEPLEWQRDLLDILLARDERDKYAFRTIGISIPRQNGKSWCVRSRCFYGSAIDGEKILYTCQHGDTADEMFKALSFVFEDEDNVELHELLKAVRKTNGQQAIYLENGGYIRFTTRTNNLARGKTYDVIIYDEAQELTQGQLAASMPTISASSKHNTQVIFIGTPPEPEANGDVFRKMHDGVHDGSKPDTAWVEWSVDDIGDPNDVSRWFETNPSLGTLIDESAVKSEAEGFDPDTFARERLGWWSNAAESSVEHVIQLDSWRDCTVDDAPSGGIVTYAVKFAPDGSTGSISSCVKPDSGPLYVEAIDNRNMADGITWFVDAVVSRAGASAQIVLDGGPNAQTLADLVSGRVDKHVLLRPSSSQVAGACSMLLNDVNEGTVTHIDQYELERSATMSERRKIGSSGWGFGSNEEADATIVESCALALWAATVTKRDPRRKMRVL